MMTARQLMTENPVTVDVKDTAGHAARTLQTLDIRHLPVIDEDGELVGMLSDRDLRSLSFPHLLGDEHAGAVQVAMGASVASLMNSDVISVGAEDEVSEIIDLMLEHKIGAVPVVESDGSLIGIVSYMDVLRELGRSAAGAAQ